MKPGGTIRTEHGDTRGRRLTPEYRSFIGMRGRCSNPKSADWADYGGRGIRVCERWRYYANFLADMGRKHSPTHSLDRIDTNGNYEPGNCRWATPQEQARNRRPRRRRTLIACPQGHQYTAENTAVAKKPVPGRQLPARKCRICHRKRWNAWYRVRHGEPRPPRCIEVNGQKRTIADLARESGMAQRCLEKRLERGWTIGRALATPVGSWRRK